MLKKLLKNTAFRHEVKKFYIANKNDLVDILVFGSVMRGKEKPGDIDILLVFKDKVRLDLQNYFRNKIVSFNQPFEVTAVSYKELFSPTFIAHEAFLLEGYSLVNNLSISEGLGFKSFTMIKYDLSGLTKSKRMRFYFSLNGRNGKKGMLTALNSIKFSEELILAPIKYSEEFKEYLKGWHITYSETPVLIPSRVTESKVFKMQ